MMKKLFFSIFLALAPLASCDCVDDKTQECLYACTKPCEVFEELCVSDPDSFACDNAESCNVSCLQECSYSVQMEKDDAGVRDAAKPCWAVCPCEFETDPNENCQICLFLVCG